MPETTIPTTVWLFDKGKVAKPGFLTGSAKLEPPYLTLGKNDEIFLVQLGNGAKEDYPTIDDGRLMSGYPGYVQGELCIINQPTPPKGVLVRVIPANLAFAGMKRHTRNLIKLWAGGMKDSARVAGVRCGPGEWFKRDDLYWLPVGESMLIVDRQEAVIHVKALANGTLAVRAAVLFEIIALVQGYTEAARTVGSFEWGINALIELKAVTRASALAEARPELLSPAFLTEHMSEQLRLRPGTKSGLKSRK